MKKAFFILFIAVQGWAACPLWTYPENHKIDQEFHNTCSNISQTNTTVSTNKVYQSVKDYGAKCDGSTDDTLAIQAAINKAGTAGDGITYFPSGTCNISKSLNLLPGSVLVGTYRPGNAEGTTIVNTNASTCTFNLYNSNAAGPSQFRGYIGGFNVTGGSSTVCALNGAVNVTIQYLQSLSPAFAGIYQAGFIQDWHVQAELQNGQYGVYFASGGTTLDGSPGSQMLYDKNQYNLFCNGENINCVYAVIPSWSNGTGTSDQYQMEMTSIGQDGAVFNGGLQSFDFYGINTEDIGSNDDGTRVTYVSTTTAGDTRVIVSTVGLTVGTTVTIQGAGTAGADWFPYITGIWISSVTMNTTAPLSVNNTEFTNRRYSSILLNGPSSAVTLFNFYDPNMVVNTSSRYSIDASNARFVNIVGGTMSRPTYDPSFTVGYYGGSASGMRRASGYIGDTWSMPTLGGNGSLASVVPSPLGGDLILALVDSTANSGGTFGKISIRKPAVNGSTASVEIASITSSGSFYSNGTLLTGGSSSNLNVAYGSGRGTGVTDIIVPSSQFTGSVSGSSVTLQLNSSSVTLQGNTFNGNSQLMQTDSTGHAPAISGGLLTNLNGANIIAGPITNVGLVGTTTNDNATAGNYGEYISSVTTSATGFGLTSGQYKDVCAVTLTAGDWDITFQGAFNPSSPSIVVTDAQVGISSTAGNNGSGLSEGDNLMNVANSVSTTNDYFNGVVTNWRASHTGTVTYYGKVSMSWTTGTVTGFGRCSARRMR